MTSRTSQVLAAAAKAYLESHRHRPLLRFMTCGSVDDGKSTLIGRLLYESHLLFEDQLAALEADSKRLGTRGDGLDFALLVDGLMAERVQGITIDVAYRFFSTHRRKFIVADAPGHEQYTRNMVTAASTADLAVILVDARKGVLTQTRRHSYLLRLLGIRHVVLAVNKMDLVDYARDRFAAIVSDYQQLATRIGLTNVIAIPMSAVDGDNIVRSSAAMPWYDGPCLMTHLEHVEIGDDAAARPFRLPVQLVIRPHSEFRGYAGPIVSGTVRAGDRVRVLPSGRDTRIARIVTADGDQAIAVTGQSVMLTLADEIDVSRGDVVAAADEPCPVADHVEATLVWMDEKAMPEGRAYLMKVGTMVARATVAPLKHKIDVDTLAPTAADSLHLNEIGVCELRLDRPVAFESYAENRELGGVILIDRLTNHTVAAGLLHGGLHRSENVRPQLLDVNKQARSSQKHQRAGVVWLTGLSGAGKSTIANLAEQRLVARGCHTYLLDGDNVRRGLNRDLGFTEHDRVENIRRVAEVARLMVDAGLLVLVAFISPFRAERRTARELFEPDEFVEVYVATPIEVAEARDPKGLYRKARRGELNNFTGIDSPYEPPESPEIHLDTTQLTADAAADRIVAYLAAAGFLGDRRHAPGGDVSPWT
jgi:bifunctional enzyme CysN/CysC